MASATRRQQEVSGSTGNGSFDRPGLGGHLAVIGVAAGLLVASCAAPPSHQRLMSTVPSHWMSGAQRARPNDVVYPGDVLRIQVWRQPEFSGEFLVGPDSLLVHPLYRNLKLGGLQLTAVREQLIEFLGTFVQDPDLVAEPLYPVAVAGEVRQPNLYHVSRGTTVAQAIAQAGGPTPQGRMDRVVLQRGDSTTTFSLTAEYSQWGTVPLRSGDQVFVQRAADFRFLRDVFQPVTTLALLVLNIVRVGQNR